MNAQPLVLFVDDDPKAGELMLRFSESASFSCKVFQDPALALAEFKQHGADLIVSDLRMPGMSGTDLLQAIRTINDNVPFIIITGYANIDDAIEALRLGANDFIKKPFDMDELQVLIDKTLGHRALLEENRLLKRQLSDERQRFGMVGHAAAIEAIYHTIEKIADKGNGNYAYIDKYDALPFEVGKRWVLASQATTGAHKAKQGLLPAASGGTVFLDEIGNISDAMQIKLLRVIQEQQITPVGGLQPINIDVRFIVATNRNLEELILKGKFRADLYHRLNVVNITMPPLRERREDIPLLVQHFVDHYARHYHREVTGFDAESMQLLLEHDWPGNVRELQNLVERHVALADKPLMHLETITSLRGQEHIDSDLPTLAELEQRYIQKVLDRFNQSREKTAETLGVNKSTLWRKLQSYKTKTPGEE